MDQKTDDLEEKVNLLLENIELKEKLGQYEISQKLLESKVSELEGRREKYRFEKKVAKDEIKSQIKEWLPENFVENLKIVGLCSMGVLMIGSMLYGCYHNIFIGDRPRIRNMIPAFVEAANSKKEKELLDYINCEWGLQDNNSPIEEIINKVLNEGYTIEQITITGIESYKFFCQEGRPCYYSVAFETYLLQQGKDTKFKGLLPVSCDGDCKFNIVKNRIKSCPAYATIEKDEE